MFYKLVRFFGQGIFKFLYPMEFVHKENLIKEGKNIIVCNHLGKADVGMIATLYKGKTYFLAKKEWFANKLVSKVLTSLGGIAVDREKPSFQTMRQGLNVLNENKRLCIFPEGTRNKVNNKLQEIKQGTAFFAIKSKSKITPIIIQDRMKMFKKTYVIIGEPFDFSEFYDVKFSEEISKQCTEKISKIMHELQQEVFAYVDEKKKKKGKVC